MAQVQKFESPIVEGLFQRFLTTIQAQGMITETGEILMRAAFITGFDYGSGFAEPETQSPTGYCTIKGQHRMVDCNGEHEGPET